MSTVLPDPAAAPVPAKETTPPKGPDCPHCNSPLSDPEGMAFCPACGYCRQAEPTARPRRRTSSGLGASEFIQTLTLVPPWLALLLGGVFLVLGVSVIAHHQLPRNSFPQALWGLVQLLLGLVITVVAHFWAGKLVPDEEVRARSRGRYSIVGLWRAAIAFLPDTRRPVQFVSWGLTLTLCAVFLIGGQMWWIEKFSNAVGESAEARRKRIQIEAKMAQLRRLEELHGLNDGGKIIPDPLIPPKVVVPPPIPKTAQVVILGFQTDARGALTGLVVARVHDGKPIYAGVVAPALPEKEMGKLLSRLRRLQREDPVMQSLKSEVAATWVTPAVGCEVDYAGEGLDGSLGGMVFKELLN